MKYVIKCINFITAVPQNKQYLYHLWLRQTFLCLFLIISSICLLQYLQIQEKQALMDEINTITTHITQKKQQLSTYYATEKEKETLIRPQKKINLYTHRLENEHALFTYFQQHIKPQHTISSIKITKGQCEIIGSCPSTTDIYAVCDNLQKSPLLAQAHVVSMHHMQDGSVQYRIKS